MRKETVVPAAVLLLLLGAGLAQAQTATTSTAPTTVTGAPAYSWTVDSGQTVGEGNNVVRGQIGWPGLWADIIHGVSSDFDFGGRFGFNWGPYPGLTQGSGVGLTFQALLRKQMFDIGGFKVAFTFDPGFLLEFPAGGTIAGIMFPIGAQIGFPVAEKVVVNASFEMPFFVTFSPGNFFIPLLFGGGVEYMLQPNLDLTFKLALGPTFATSGGSAFTLQGLAGVAYKF
jgi:hypothetical protein